MKKIFFAVIFVFSFGTISAQDKLNEVKFNLLNTLINASVELGYERFIADNQSLDAEFHINDRFFYLPGKTKNFKTHSIKIGYNFYFDDAGLEGFYANPFLKYRFGKYEEPEASTSMSSIIIGAGAGYILNYNDTFIVAPYFTIGRNFSESVNKRFWGVEPSLGIRVGYRF